ncbi:sensor histidine kinase [Ferruginibacter sp. SUN106]|uniref:sensor histidine kinase n=1 Tax=Ferruginibacter sp. SUN106 TaxID=2978348 RepID=UPI003D35DA89
MSKLKYHLIGVGIYTATVSFIDFGLNDNVNFSLFFNVLLHQVWVFYTVYAFLYFVFLKSPKKISLGIFFLLISLVVSYGFVYWYRYAQNPGKPIDLFTKKNLVTIITYYLHFSLYSIGYFFFERSLQNQRKAALHEKSIILTEKKNLENENKILLLQDEKATLNSKLFQSETNFLRAQINPHFLQNCLNFLYSDTRKTNPDAAEAILLLSELMRYSVADNSATGGMAMLEDELNQVESIININQLRFKESLNIVFIKDGNFLNKRIVPMILLTLVENLIKYGDLNDTHNPARINCTINEAENKVLFKTINKKAFAAATSSTGLGFKNIKERLTLIWKDSFTLTHEDANGFFTVHLVMPFINVKPVGTKN